MSDDRAIEDIERWAPRPTCCMRACMTQDDISPGLGVDFGRPFVRLIDDGSGWLVGSSRASFCPFCGQKLPEVELDPFAQGPFRNCDENGHCSSCGTRYCCGGCKPRSAMFRLKLFSEARDT